MNKQLVSKYFDENSESWLSASYEGDGHAFPTALARVNRAVSILEEHFPGGNAKIVDLGCGAGQLCNRLARLGNTVTGIDESPAMISAAVHAAEAENSPVEERVEFFQRDLLNNGLEGCSFDAVTSFGVIGYLPHDDVLFAEAARLLKPGGLFVLSCRNRLFNMVSISNYTLGEAESGGAKDLIEEILELYQPIPADDALNFVKSLAQVSSALVSADLSAGEWDELARENTTGSSLQPRQHSPKALIHTAGAYGFKHEAYYGIHPHLLMAGLNRHLPPGVFNSLSSSQEALAHHPASLIWSSGFIGVFRKPA